MAKEVVCPHCGSAVAIDPPPDSILAAAPAEAHHTVELTLPATSVDVAVRFAGPIQVHDATARPDGMIGVFVAGDTVDPPMPAFVLDDSTGSADGLFVGDPDPLLGEFVPPSQDSEQATHPDLAVAVAVAEPVAPVGPAPEADAFGGLHLDTSTPPAPRPAAARPRVEEADDDEDEEPGGISLGTVLLASYASAVTLALAYVIWSHRDHGASGPETMAADSRPDRGADGPRALKPAAAIADDHIASIGQSIRVGGLEVTPVEVRNRPVRLVRAGSESRGSGRTEPGDALQLRLRIKNASESPIAPLDATLVRAPEFGPPETFLETGRGDRIDPYPLAVASEWAISGQPLGALGPGESRETLIVSEKDVADRLDDPLTWRIPIRVSAGKVESIGVRFRSGEIR